jgi:ferric-dicitrate binding protein FerR (iron transport regulator)
MSCRKAVCQECATTWDGIHYCAGCLAARRRATRRRSDWVGFVAVVAAGAALFWALTRLMAWAGVLAVSL